MATGLSHTFCFALVISRNISFFIFWDFGQANPARVQRALGQHCEAQGGIFWVVLWRPGFDLDGPCGYSVVLWLHCPSSVTDGRQKKSLISTRNLEFCSPVRAGASLLWFLMFIFSLSDSPRSHPFTLHPHVIIKNKSYSWASVQTAQSCGVEMRKFIIYLIFLTTYRVSLPPFSASDGVPSERKMQPQDSVVVRRQMHSSATPNFLLEHVIASTSRNPHHNTRTKEKLFCLMTWTWICEPSFQNCHGTGLSPKGQAGDAKGSMWSVWRGWYQRDRKWWGCSPGNKHRVDQETFHSTESCLAAQPAPRGSPLGGSPKSYMGVHEMHENTHWMMLLLMMVFIMVLNKPVLEGSLIKTSAWTQGLWRSITRLAGISNKTLLPACFTTLRNAFLGHSPQKDQPVTSLPPKKSRLKNLVGFGELTPGLCGMSLRGSLGNLPAVSRFAGWDVWMPLAGILSG